MLLTIDADGRACVWAAACGTLLRVGQLSGVQPEAGGHLLLLLGSDYAAIACTVAVQSEVGASLSVSLQHVALDS